MYNTIHHIVTQLASVVARLSLCHSVQLDVEVRVAHQERSERDALPDVCRREAEAGFFLELAPLLLFCSPATFSTRASRLRQALKAWSGSEVSMVAVRTRAVLLGRST